MIPSPSTPLAETPLLAVLFAPTSADATVAPVLAGGLTVIERQCRLARIAGAHRVVVVGSRGSGHTGAITVAEIAAIADHLFLDGRVLVIAPDIVFDARAIVAVMAQPAPAVATWPAAGPHRGVERIDATTVAAGIGVYPAAMVADVVARLGDWDFASTLLRTALIAGATRIDLAAIPAPLCVSITGVEAAREATDGLIAAARRPAPGWPDRWLYPPLRRAVVRAMLATPVTPAMIVAAHAVLVLVAAGTFVAGWRAVALVVALLCGPLDGIAAMIGRVRLEDPAERHAAMVDRISGPMWCAAVVAGFVAADGGLAPWAVGAVLAGFAAAERTLRNHARRVGIDLAGIGRLDPFAARRDTLLFAALPFALAGAWRTGFAVAAGYAMISFFAAQRAVFVEVEGRSGPGVSVR